MKTINQIKLNNLPPPPGGKTGWPWTKASDLLPPHMPDGATWPKISIVTPSYNQAQYLEETIRSVLLQNYPNLEYIIIDGGSTDGSVAIIKKHEPWLTYWVSEKDQGQSHAINKGFNICTGDMMNWVNSDDFLLPNSLNKIALAYSQRNSEIFIIAGNSLILQKNGDYIPRLPIRKVDDWLTEFDVKYEGSIQAGWFFSKGLHKLLGPLNNDLHYAMDIDYSLRWGKFDPEYLLIDESVAVFRIHEDAKTTKFIGEAIIERKELYYSHIKELPKSERTKTILRKKVNRNISWLYLTNSINPVNIKYLIKSIIHNPKRIFTLDFWRFLWRSQFHKNL